jgi:hypothetical protein
MATQNIFSMVDTWNNAGTTFTAIKMNVTDTASAAGSLLMDLQVGGSSLFSVTKTGSTNSTGNVVLSSGTSVMQMSSLAGYGYHMAAGYAVTWGNSATLNGSIDLSLFRDAANTLAQRNGTNAQAFRVYRTFTDASNYARLEMSFSGTNASIFIDVAGSGATGNLSIAANQLIFNTGVNRWIVNSSGHFVAATDNTYDIGASGATRPRNVFVGTSLIGPLVRTDFINNSSNTVTYLQFPSSGETTQFVPGGTNPRLQFGGTTSSFPSLKRSTTSLQVRLADDSAFGSISGLVDLTATQAADSIGTRGVPQNSQSAAYTLVIEDAGKHILHPSADTTARTFTIPANGTVAFPVGTAVTFVNQNGAGVITIAITTDTMRLAGAGTTGNRTLAANGIATAVKITSTEWIISGTGLT